MKHKLWSALVLAVAVATAPSAHALLTIRITKGIEGALPIAVVPFGWTQGTAPPEDIGGIVAADLARTGRFAPVPAADLPSRPSRADQVNFSDWRLLGTGDLVIGSMAPAAKADHYTIEFRLFDVFRGSQIAGYQFDATRAQLRRTAHRISDIVYEKLTGERGAFDTRIAYVTEDHGKDGKAHYALSVADSDGYDAHTVLASTEPVLSPAWSPDGRSLAYVSMEGGRPRIFIQDLGTGQRREVAGFPGLNGAPAFSPDGRYLAMTLSKDGNAEIYVEHLESGRLRRLTNDDAIDTEAAWSPDGTSIVFTSDRGGTPQLYRMSAEGGRAERVTFEGKYNARAAFSPDGKKLAFVHADDTGFHIALLDLQNHALRVLTDTGLDESPSFAPNGSMILYATTDSGGATLAAVSTDGRVRQRIAVQEGAVREPAWSPFRAP